MGFGALTTEDPYRTSAAPGERLSVLCAASLRIGASLDVETVLREVVENARTLTGAHWGVIATMDESGAPQEWFSSGLAEDEHQRLAERADGRRLFKRLRDLSGPQRIADIQAHLMSLGFSAEHVPSRCCLCVPLRHRGVHLGNFYLVGTEDRSSFSIEDEEVAVLFASHAAAAIANARAYHAEQHARTHLEALVETSPVGVAVFDARTGRALSLNREFTRIVDTMRTPGVSDEALLQVITCRRADGREIALGRFPLTDVLKLGETVRAEEMVLSTPDGRSARMIVNGTPIRAPDGEIESVVVTVQSLAALTEMERKRAEFLSRVSHELRTPLTSIKGSTTAVLGAARALDPVESREFFRIVDQQADLMIDLIADLLDAGRIDAGTLSVSPESLEVRRLVEQARDTFLSGGRPHPVHVDLPPELPPVMADRGRIVQVLNNLLANAAGNAPVSSPIRIAARADGVHVAISVTDKGKGIPPERMKDLFRKHSGALGDRESGSGGSGLGLAICKGLVEAHGGRIWADSAGVGRGARFTFTLPAFEATIEGRDASPPNPTAAPRAERSPLRILVVDDDPLTLRAVREALDSAAYAVSATGDPQEVPRIIATERPALVLLDLILPDADGIELLERFAELRDLPVIFISGYNRDETIARALEAGATDYIVKPFSPTELAARVRAALRKHPGPEPFMLGKLAIDYERRQVTVAGRPLQLTATEYELLRVLSLDTGKVVTYESLLRRVWGGRVYADPKKLVRAFVRSLRRKLGDDAGDPTYVVNSRGVGYSMPEPSERRSDAG